MKRFFRSFIALLSIILLTLTGCGTTGIIASVAAGDIPSVSPTPDASPAEQAASAPTVSPAVTQEPAAEPTAMPTQQTGSTGGIVTDTHATGGTAAASPLPANGDGGAQTLPGDAPGTDGLDANALPTPAMTMSPDIDPDKPMIALTFDDGPSKSATASIIDTLELYGARATFFVVGTQLIEYPYLTSRACRIGCEIGSHTYGHANLKKISDDEFHAQVDDMVEMIHELTDSAPKLLRPPYGARDDRVRALSKYPLILWSIDTLDWSTRDTQSTVDAILNYVRDGDIVLMHDLYDTTAAAVAIVVPELISRGYQLVTVSEMFAAKGIELLPGQDYRKTY